MLHHRRDALRLHARDVLWREGRPKPLVLAREVLGVAPVARHPVHVHAGPQNAVRALGAKLAAEGVPKTSRELPVPSGAEAEQARPRRGHAYEAAVALGGEALGGVLHVDRWDAEPGDRVGAPDVEVVLQLAHRPPHALDQAQQLVTRHRDRQRARSRVRRRPIPPPPELGRAALAIAECRAQLPADALAPSSSATRTHRVGAIGTCSLAEVGWEAPPVEAKGVAEEGA